MTLGELAARLSPQATLRGIDDEERTFTGFALDNREVRPGNVFIAIKGERVDGHDFVPAALSAGAVAAIVERQVSGPQIVVPNLIEALGHLGQSLRQGFHGPVVGITGSNGKTSTKEMTAAALSPLGTVLKNFGNQNSEYTSPLTWFELNSTHQSAVIEMGMRGKGQIKHLASVALPTLGLITMIGTAHAEMVGGRQGIAEAKAELFEALPKDGIAHLWAEDDFADFLRSKAPGLVRTFGFGPSADLRIVHYQALDLDRCEITISLGSQSVTLELPTVGRHQALNAAAALLVAHSAGVPLAPSAQALSNVQLPPMRMEIREMAGVKVLLDAYNASPDSMVAALQTLAELPCAGRRVAVLGEMKELGSLSESGHRQVGRLLAQTPLDAVLVFGDETRFIVDEAQLSGFSPHRIAVAQSLNDVRQFLSGLEPGDLALVKGSRALELERALTKEVLT